MPEPGPSAPTPDGGAAEETWPAPDTTTPQLTLRAVSTGMALGGALSLCNVYLGLKIGWGMNMSVTAALLGFAFWQASTRLFRLRPFNVLENNLNQTAASAGAAISSAGLVAPIPALAMLTGQTLSWSALAAWVFSVGLVGVVVAVVVRRQLLIVDRLPFPGGVATGETLRQMYATGGEAMARVRVLLAGMALGAGSKGVELVLHLPKLAFPGQVGSATAYNLGFALDPSLMMVAIGAIVGMRAAASMLLGSAIAWLGLAPMLLANGWAQPGKPDGVWFTSLVQWLLWPGVTLMVVASLSSLAFSWRAIARAFRTAREAVPDVNEVPRPALLAALGVVLVLSVTLQVWLFDVSPALAAIGVLLSFALALVAGRVSGETGITPVGAMGKVTQLTFGVLDPGNVASNLMTANVTGGAASQCADLLHDLKSGLMLGAAPRMQAIAQGFGVLAGALCGSAAYLVLIPDPKSMLITEEWAAPAVATWKAVAEVFKEGLHAMPQGAPLAMAVAAVAAVILVVLEKKLPAGAARWVPSPASLGLAFTIQAYTSISFFVGAAIVTAAYRYVPDTAARFAIVLAAGVIAGESLAGVGDAMRQILAGM